MKKIIRTLAFVVLALSLTNCEKESEGLTRITYYAEITLEGGTVAIPLNGTFTDPGYTADENGVDVTSDMEVDDNIDATTIGAYNVNYKVANADGYFSEATRVVVVYDATAPADDFSGAYTTLVPRIRGGATLIEYHGSTVIEKLGPGFFSVSCLLGGSYSNSAENGYGSNYAMKGYMLLNADNTLSLVSSFLIGWGDSLEDFSGTYDPVSGLPTWESTYAGGDIFAVNCSK